MEAVIQLKSLSVRFGSFLAVNNLDLDLYRGELFGLLGPNGAGKSTTVRVLIGQRRPSEGQALVCGHDVTTAWAKIKPLVGYVPDRDNHFDEFTGRRNLQFFAGLYHVPESRVDACLKLVELDERRRPARARLLDGDAQEAVAGAGAAARAEGALSR